MLSNPTKHQKSLKLIIVFFSLNLFFSCTQEKPIQVPAANAIIKITEKVANRYIHHNKTDDKKNTEELKGEESSQLHGANSMLYSGMFQLSKVSHYPKYINWLIKVGERNKWEVDAGNDKRDDYSVSQLYLSIYEHPHLKRKQILAPTQAKINAILDSNRRKVHFIKSSAELFQKPQVLAKLARINKNKTYAYLEYLDAQYKKVVAELWDKEAHLFYTDSSSVDKKEKSGNKLFSSSSNSAVFAGLALLISDVPKHWGKKFFYEDLFKKMAKTLKKRQRKDGTWFKSLLGDANENKNSEISATSFFTFGIAWGINNGLLDKENYEPVLLKAWNNISVQVHKNGEINLPKSANKLKAHTSSFGIGGFLAAGSEMHTYITRFYPIDKTTNYTTFMEDGGWCWYQDPRVIISNKKLLIAGISGQSGNLRLGVFDLQKEHLDSVLVLDENAGIDDHNVAALYKRPDKSVLAVWAKHAREKKHYSSISASPDYLKWGATATFNHDYKARMGVTYMNLYYLKKDKKLYNFFRDGLNFNPSFIISPDHGKTWVNRTHFISNDVKGFQRPYTRYLQVDENTIGISYTDAHPRNFGNNLYYAEFTNNNFYTVDGTFIKSLEDGPLLSSSAEKIYTGSNTKKKPFVNESVPNSAWTSAMEKDKNNNPHIGYTLYLNDNDVRFRIASWDGNQWNDREIAYAGKCLYKIESSYTGLLAFDPEDPTSVYISTDVNPSTGEDLGGKHEIYTATIDFNENISTIKWKALTTNSPHRNIRPIVVSAEGYKVLLWLYGPWRTFKNYDSNVVGKILERPE